MITNKLLTTFALSLYITTTLTGCSTSTPRWSDAQKASLTTITVTEPTIPEDAYRSPRAIDSGGASRNINGQGFYNGLPIGLILGAAIDGAVAAVQQSKYDSKNSQYYEAAKLAVTQNSTTSLKSSINDTLKKNTFVAPLLTEDSSNKLSINVMQHGLTRASNTTVDDMDLLYYLKSKVTLVNASGEVLLDKDYTSSSFTRKKLTQLLSEPTLLEQNKKEAYDLLARFISSDILIRTLPEKK